MQFLAKEEESMARCIRCGNEFNVTTARRILGRYYGSGVYNEYYPDGDVCESCAVSEIGGDFEAGEEAMELAELSGYEWDD